MTIQRFVHAIKALSDDQLDGFQFRRVDVKDAFGIWGDRDGRRRAPAKWSGCSAERAWCVGQSSIDGCDDA